jgi:hypothetical protein
MQNCILRVLVAGASGLNQWVFFLFELPPLLLNWGKIAAFSFNLGKINYSKFIGKNTNFRDFCPQCTLFSLFGLVPVSLLMLSKLNCLCNLSFKGYTWSVSTLYFHCISYIFTRYFVPFNIGHSEL